MSNNEFVNRAEMEARKEQALTIRLMFEEIKQLKLSVAELKQGQRTIREDLRNINSLRPLKS